jgi:hypothetical protein
MAVRHRRMIWCSKAIKVLPVFTFALIGAAASVGAWDYEGHRVVNQLALASLPLDFPAFVHEPGIEERIAFLAGEPDRWRNTQDVTFRHANGPDHYIDLEELGLYGLKPDALPVFRYDFVAELALARKAHPEKFKAIDPARNEDHTRELVGFLPWAITENYGKLKSGFSYLKAFQENGGTSDEISNAQANIIYIMGVMGHYVGDSSQPLHATIHHHGWIGDNPRHYSTNGRIHSWIDGGFFNKIGGANLAELKTKVRPAHPVSIQERAAQPEEIFQATMLFIMDQQKLVEPLYQLDRDGKLSGDADTVKEGRAFLEGQLLKGGQQLGDIWLSGWKQAPPDSYLAAQLAKRKHSGAPAQKTR